MFLFKSTIHYYVVSVLLLIATGSSGAHTFENENIKHDALYLDSSRASVYIGTNAYTKTGSYEGTSYVWSVNLDSISTKWKTAFPAKIVEIEGSESHSILSVKCFFGKQDYHKTYLINQLTGAILDSLKQVRLALAHDNKTIIYVSDYMVSGGSYTSKLDLNVFVRKIGEQSLRTIPFHGLTFRIRTFGDTLILLAVPQGGKSLLSVYRCDLSLPNDTLKSIGTLSSVALGEESVVEIMDRDVYVVGDVVYRIKENRAEKGTIKKFALDSIAGSGREFCFYRNGFIYLKDSLGSSYAKSEFDEQFDDFGKLMEQMGDHSHAVQLLRSFYYRTNMEAVVGTIRNRNRTLTINQIR